MRPLLEAIEECQAAVQRSRAQHYLEAFDDSGRELEQGVQVLEQMQRDMRPGRFLEEEERGRLRVALELLRRELRQAEAVHFQAAALRSGWAMQLASVLGIEPSSGYGAEALPQLAHAAGRITLEG